MGAREKTVAAAFEVEETLNHGKVEVGNTFKYNTDTFS